MTSPALHLDILPAAQRRLWDELVDVPGSFVLYGGTAIALHLRHRQSVDFDLFGSERFDPDVLHRTPSRFFQDRSSFKSPPIP